MTRQTVAIVLLLLAAAASWYVARALQSDDDEIETSEMLHTGFYLRSARILGTGEDGNPLFEIEAEYAEQQENDDADDIDPAALPDAFVIKATHGSGWNLIVPDKSALDWGDAKRSLQNWLARNYYAHKREWQYRDIPPRLIVEEFLDPGGGAIPSQYQFFCFRRGENRTIRPSATSCCGCSRPGASSRAPSLLPSPRSLASPGPSARGIWRFTAASGGTRCWCHWRSPASPPISPTGASSAPERGCESVIPSLFR